MLPLLHLDAAYATSTQGTFESLVDIGPDTRRRAQHTLGLLAVARDLSLELQPGQRLLGGVSQLPLILGRRRHLSDRASVLTIR